MQAFAAHGPSAAGSVVVLPAAVGTGPVTSAQESGITLPELDGYSDTLFSSPENRAGSFVETADRAASPGHAANLPAVDATIVQLQPQLQPEALTPAADAATAGITAAIPSKQQHPFAAASASETDTGKEGLYEALWQWAANTTGEVSCQACLPGLDISIGTWLAVTC